MRVRPLTATKSRTAATAPRRHHDPVDRTPPGPPPPAAPPARDARADRIRLAGGPEDRASFSCGCGHVFETAVTTSVRCPRCGGQQAW